jgi:tripartite-type tricarboxylate transporter receptor subunit TctC
MRRFLVAAALLAGLLTDAPAFAQDYPGKRITLVVAFAPGGFADTFARIVGQKLGERWPQPVIVENRAGAGGNTAAKAVSTATPDG